jgi:hypothetical protein
MERIITVGEMKKIIAESSNEFKAKLGPGVESKEKEINGKAISDEKKRVKDFDGGLSKEVGEDKAKYEKTDDNRTTLDYEPENATPEYRSRVHAQALGYASEKEMNNGIEKSGDFSDNENIYKEFKKSGEEHQANVKLAKTSGLVGRELPEKTFDKDNMYESKDGFDMRQMMDRLSTNTTKNFVSENQIKTIHFKKTEFLSERHMISKIPDDFKVEGTSFRMKDKNANEYLVEWKNNRAYVVNHICKDQLNEEMNRMRQLMGYKSSDSMTTSSSRSGVNDESYRSTLNKIRDIKG